MILELRLNDEPGTTIPLSFFLSPFQRGEG